MLGLDSRDFRPAAWPQPFHCRASPPQPAPGATDRLLSCRWLAWPLPVGRAVRACSDALRAGWLARQAIVSEGQEAGQA